jgi:hypothetical protein
VEVVGTFTSPQTTNSRASDDDTGQVEGAADPQHVDTSHNDTSHYYHMYGVHV